MKEAELEVIRRLERNHLEDNKCFDDYRQWVRSLSKESLKGVISGCATFRLNNSVSRMFAATKAEKLKAKYNVEVSDIYLNFAKEIFYCA